MKWFMPFIFLLILISFQNCSNVNLSPVEEPLQTNLSKPINKLCAPQGSSFGAPMRFVFVVDMSMSNLGTLNANTFDNVTHYSINSKDGPSDPNGDRFLQIKKFITDCGGSENTGYSVIGFSASTLFSTDNSCLSPFESQQKAIQSVDGLKGLQDHDKKIPGQERVNPYYLQGETYYSVGLGCLKSKIQEEISLSTTEKPIYNVFFITDGMTTDAVENQKYSQIINEIQLSTSASAGGFNFYPVFYTSPGAKNQGLEQTKALTVLDSLAALTNPKQKTILLNNISSSSTQLCQSLSQRIPVNYELKKIYAVNLTSIMKKNSIFADSDMDGVTDTEELQFGWDPLNPRSTGFLDSLCLKLGKDKSRCLLERSKMTCSEEIKSLGMNECDLKFAHQYFGLPLTNIDTDRDGLQDFIEIIKGLNPARHDAFENPSGDGFTNEEKVILGLDIKSNLNLYPVDENSQISLRFQESSASCENKEKAYDYELESIPLKSTEKYSDPSSESNNLSHEKDENVILLFSQWQSLGGLSLPNKVFYQKILIPLNKSDYRIQQSSFIGEIQ